MTVLYLCINMWLGICGQVREIEFKTPEACDKALASIPKETLGKGYALCYPKGAMK